MDARPEYSHKADEMRRFSNLGHWAEGALLALVGLIGMLDWLGILTGAWRYAWPVLLLAAGLFLPVVIFGHGHETYEPIGGRAAVWNDPQQRQHLLMGVLLLLAGAAEVGGLAFGFRWLQYGWPIALVVIGILFGVHTQQGSSEALAASIRYHRFLGGILAAAGLARASVVLTGNFGGVLGLGWIVLAILAALLLLLYREPAGAYETESGHNN